MGKIVFDPPLTLEEFHRLPETKPALEMGEDGEIEQKVSPSSEHARIQLRLASQLDDYGARHQLGFAFTEHTIELDQRDKVPDVSFYRAERLPLTAEGRLTFHPTTPPDLVAEIVSPSQEGSNRAPLERKCRDWWAAHGVKVVLLIDPERREIDVYRAPATEPHTYAGNQPLPLAEILPGFQLTPDQVFAALEPMLPLDDETV